MVMPLDYKHTLGISEKLIKTKNLYNTIYIYAYIHTYIYINLQPFMFQQSPWNGNVRTSNEIEQMNKTFLQSL